MTCTVVHYFVEASKHANGAVVFFTQNNEVSFVAAKTRVAPLKTLTITCLEFMVALVSNCLTYFVILVPNLPVLFSWSDSQIALHWNKSQKPNLVLIQNHITESNSLLPTAIWNCCPTANNPTQEVLLLPHYLYHPTYGNMDPLHQTIGHHLNHHHYHHWS